MSQDVLSLDTEAQDDLNLQYIQALQTIDVQSGFRGDFSTIQKTCRLYAWTGSLTLRPSSIVFHAALRGQNTVCEYLNALCLIIYK